MPPGGADGGTMSGVDLIGIVVDIGVGGIARGSGMPPGIIGGIGLPGPPAICGGIARIGNRAPFTGGMARGSGRPPPGFAMLSAPCAK